MGNARKGMSQREFMISKGYTLFGTCYENDLNAVVEKAKNTNYVGIKVQRIRTDIKGLKKYEIWVLKGTNKKVLCPCHEGDEAVWWQNENYNAFIDSNGEMMVTINGYEKCFPVDCCPKCGKKF